LGSAEQVSEKAEYMLTTAIRASSHTVGLDMKAIAMTGQYQSRARSSNLSHATGAPPYKWKALNYTTKGYGTVARSY
jgi:hypothetical protein